MNRPFLTPRACWYGPAWAGLCLALAVAACTDPPPPSFTSAFPTATTRVWAGEAYYANRLMDWRVHDGRLECLEGRTAKPMRTVHLLTHALRSTAGTVTLSVRTGAIAAGESVAENTWTGFLIGAGGDHVDFRISALVHHWPAADGGLIVALDGTGRLVVRDNTNVDAPKGPRANIPVTAWPLIPATTYDGDPVMAGDVLLRVVAMPVDDAYRLTVTAEPPGGGEALATAIYDGIAAEHLTGTVALVSHNSPRGDGAGYWFRDWTVAGTKVEARAGRAFGPVMGTQYTLSRGTLKLTAQMPPLGDDDTQTAELQLRRASTWETVATGTLTPHSYTIPFRVEGWTDTTDVPYRVAYDLRTGDSRSEPRYYRGTIRRDPVDQETFVLGAMNCHHISGGDGSWNHNHIWYPHNELAAAVAHHDPDMLFFAGDQIYEGGLAGIIRTPPDKAAIDYLYHWYRWVWAFRDLTRDRPTITIPDDHDVYHGNIWGAGGKAATGPFVPASDNGGYIMDPLFVNAVHRTQVSHLPDPYDPTPIDQDISVYYTDVQYGGVSFAVIADRMWKSPPRVIVPAGDVVNGWPQNPDFDPVTEADVPGAILLGERQHTFLDQWAHDWSGGTWMKVFLSQTLFSNVATIPEDATSGRVIPGLPNPAPGEYPPGYKKAADLDSGGWPQSGRNRAIDVMRQALAFHVAGDQHLGSTVKYGIDAWDDAPYGFVVPSIANVWPRRWWPPEEGRNRKPGSPRYTGQFVDGFGNRMTVHAVANPVDSGQEPRALYDRTPGYGIVRMHRATREVSVEAWPRWVDPAAPGAAQYLGWPVQFNQQDNDGRAAAGYLPTLVVTGMAAPVVQVIHEGTGARLYTLRITGDRYRPKVFDAGATYTIRIGEPGTDRMQTLAGLQVVGDDAVLEVDFQ